MGRHSWLAMSLLCGAAVFSIGFALGFIVKRLLLF